MTGCILAFAAVLAVLGPSIAAAAEIAPPDRRSDTIAMSPALRAMQADDAANPGMLSVLDGEALWNTRAGDAARSCADCHGPAATGMRGVAARHPAWNKASGAPMDLTGRIEMCRTENQRAPPLPAESPDLLALSAYVAHQSRGMPISPPDDPGTAAARERGRRLFTARIGQLDLSCAACHDDNWGKRLAGSPIPQGHPVGYPAYRLEWQALGSLQRRLRNCMSGVRAEPYRFDAPELVDLEAYLMGRAAGLAMETPAVRP
ncbi:MAG: cytochrome [Enterovirga sp.]|nr:cytochrome [Enterovirga sp.]